MHVVKETLVVKKHSPRASELHDGERRTGSKFLVRSALMHVVKKHQTHPSDSDNTSGRRARRRELTTCTTAVHDDVVPDN